MHQIYQTHNISLVLQVFILQRVQDWIMVLVLLKYYIGFIWKRTIGLNKVRNSETREVGIIQS